MTFRIIPLLLVAVSMHAAEIDWARINEETLRHSTALIQIETNAVAYIKKVLEADGIPAQVLAVDPKRPSLVAHLKGNGTKKPLLIMAHTDTRSALRSGAPGKEGTVPVNEVQLGADSDHGGKPVRKS